MKHDMVFLRDLLLQMEAGRTVFETVSAEVAASLGYVPEKPLSQEEADKLRGHLDLLEEKGLIEIEMRSAAGAYYIKGLTLRGGEFLERELGQEVKPPSRKDEMPSRTETPDIEWYLRISAERGVTPRCPFASVECCPRYYQSLSALGRAKISVELTPSEDKRLHLYWEKSELWSKSEENSTNMFGNGEKYHSFSNFCPEVAYERFKYFAGQLVDYYDAEERDAAHQRLTGEICPSESWQWSWASLKPLHFTECPLYSPLIHAVSATKQQPRDAILMPTKFGRDKNLIRTLMLRLDGILRPGATTVLNGNDAEVAVEGYTSEQINHHLSLLAQMGYVDLATSQPAIGAALKGLTPKGYDFLDRNRDGLEETPHQSVKAQLSRKVFIVHGHDEAARVSVARFLEIIGFEAIILHEQANRGRTIIEKFEAHGDVGFAVVLLTPDDRGGGADQTELQQRARQNVILEWGYFIGRLGRSHVCAIKKGDIELPSDILGVVWEPFDERGAWKQKLAKELEEAGFEIDWRKVGRS